MTTTSSGLGDAISQFGSERRSQPRLLHLNSVRLGEFDQAAETALFLGLVVDEDFGQAVIEKGIAEPFDDGRAIGLRLFFHTDPGEDRQHFLVEELVELGADRLVRHRLSDSQRRRKTFSHPDLRQIRMAQVENEQLQPLERLEIVGHRDRGVTARKLEAGLALDRPKRIGLSHCADWLERFGDNPVDERIDPDALVLDPAARLHRRFPAVEHAEHRGAQRLAVGRRQFAREERDRPGAGAMAGEQELGELGRKRPRRPRVRTVGGIGLVAAVGGVRDRAACFVEPALDVFPLRRCVETRADARHLDALVDDFSTREPFDLDEVRLARGKGFEALAALLAGRRLHDSDAAHGLPPGQRLADENVDMRLQEAAGAELDDRECGQKTQISMSALITPVSGLIQIGKLPGASSSETRWVTSASVGTSPSRIAPNTLAKSCGVALRLPSSEVSRLWNSGSAKQIVSRTTLTRTYVPPWAT